MLSFTSYPPGMILRQKDKNILWRKTWEYIISMYWHAYPMYQFFYLHFKTTEERLLTCYTFQMSVLGCLQGPELHLFIDLWVFIHNTFWHFNCCHGWLFSLPASFSQFSVQVRFLLEAYADQPKLSVFENSNLKSSPPAFRYSDPSCSFPFCSNVLECGLLHGTVTQSTSCIAIANSLISSPA